MVIKIKLEYPTYGVGSYIVSLKKVVKEFDDIMPPWVLIETTSMMDVDYHIELEPSAKPPCHLLCQHTLELVELLKKLK